MKIAVVGGGPSGLYFSILVKRAEPETEIVVFERNRPDDTFGFGVVFSDATIAEVEGADGRPTGRSPNISCDGTTSTSTSGAR
jgi:anthraniloyl-CoA monooxygenase